MKQISAIIINLTLILAGSQACGSIFNVDQDGSGDFTAIQPAIEGAAAGDTVLVAPGIYDSIDFEGKDLLVASNYLITGSHDDIEATVITPSNGGSCVKFDNDETRSARLLGFTLRDGWGTYFIYDQAGGGVYIQGASPTLQRLVITDCWGWGAGVFVYNGSPRLISLEIHNNLSEGVMPAGGGVYLEFASGSEILNCDIHDNYSRSAGGGIAAESSTDLILRDNRIRRNKADYGGGVRLDYQCSAMFKDNLIVGNTAKSGGGLQLYQQSEAQLKGDCITGNHARQGGGLHLGVDCTITFNTITKCSVYGNKGLWGRDIQVLSPDIVPVVLDTFSVSQPTSIHASPPGQTEISFEHALWSQVDGDIYVATDGDDGADGTSAEQALRTIHHALARLAPSGETVRTIHLAPGTYSPSLTGEVFPQLLLERTHLVGSGQDDTTLDAEGTFSGIVCGLPSTEDEDLAVRDLKITGAMNWGAVRCYSAEVDLENLILSGNSDDSVYSSWNGSDFVCAGVSIWGGQVVLKDSSILENSAHLGAAAVACTDGAALRMQRVLVANNESDYGRIITLIHQSRVGFYNNTITGNDGGQNAAGIILRGEGSHLSLINTIVWDNEGPQISFRGDDLTDTLLVAHSDLEDGEAGLDHSTLGVVTWLEGNIDADPLFVDPAVGGNYALSPGSLCIDAGTAFFYHDNPFFQMEVDPEDIIGPAPDMGVYEYSPMVAVMNDAVPGLVVLGYPHPNPFNPRTIINFSLDEQAAVTLCIYDVGGSLVQVLVNDQVHAPGLHSAQWDGKNVQGKSMPSGVYFFRVETGKYDQTVRATLIR